MRLSSLSSTSKTVFPFAVIDSTKWIGRRRRGVLLPLPDRLQTSSDRPGKPQFPYHGPRRAKSVSYAGPASRATRASDMQLVGTRSTATGRTGGQDARPRAQTSAPREGRATVFTAGLLVGLAIGAGVALLVAPQTGAETRQALVRRGRRLRRRGVD